MPIQQPEHVLADGLGEIRGLSNRMEGMDVLLRQVLEVMKQVLEEVRRRYRDPQASPRTLFIAKLE